MTRTAMINSAEAHRTDKMEVEGGLMVNVALGYYVRHGEYHFAMTAEPPDGQLVLRGDHWEPLPDPWYLMDKLITGDVDTDGPFADPPEGVPAVRAFGMSPL
jgi:hypothetical protein